MTDDDNSYIGALDVSALPKAAAQDFREPFIYLDCFENDEPIDEVPARECNRVLSAVLAQLGDDFEDMVCNSLRDVDDTLLIRADDWPDKPFGEEYTQVADQLRVALDRAAARAPGEGPILLFQLPLKGQLGRFKAMGHADVFLLWPSTGARVHVQTVDVKNSWTTTTGAELQSTGYARLFEQVVDTYNIPVTIEAVDAGVINRETDYDTITSPDDVPTFNRRLREGDLKHILGKEGPFSNAARADSFTDLEFTGGQTAPYAELMNLLTCESRDIGQLDFSATEQEKLRDAGYTQVDDLAAGIERPPDTPSVWADDPAIIDDDLRELAEQHEWGERLTLTAQRAQARLAVLNPDHPHAYNSPRRLYELQGTGPMNLPSEEARFDPAIGDDAPFIRVYLNVQRSYPHDKLLLISGRVCSSDSDVVETFACLVDDYFLLGDDERNADLERELLREALEDELFPAIRTVAALADTDYDATDAYLHFYAWSREEIDALVDACDRHPMVSAARECKDLLAYDSDGTQQLVSCLKPIIRSHMARPFPPYGLLPIHDVLAPTPTPDDAADADTDTDADDRADADDSFTSVTECCRELDVPNAPHAPSVDWLYSPDGAAHDVDLFANFSTQLFGYKTDYRTTDNGIEFVGEDEDHDWKLPVLPRTEANIPIEVLLDALGFFDRDWTDSQMRETQIQAYAGVELPDGTERDTTREDAKALGKQFVGALHDTERMLWATDDDMPKEPIDMATLGPNAPATDAADDRPELALALEDYLTIDHSQRQRDLQSYYERPPRERILANESLPIAIDDVEADGQSHFIVEGHLILDEFGFENPDQLASATRISGPDDGSTGSWLVANPLQQTADGTFTEHPDAKSDLNTGTNLSVSYYNPDTGRIVLDWYRMGTGRDDHAFETGNQIPVTDRDDLNANYDSRWRDRYQWLLDPADPAVPDYWMLDPAGDNRVARKCLDALDHLDTNPGYHLIQRLRNGDPIPTTTDRDDALDELLDWTRSDDCDYLPDDADTNTEQAAYVQCDRCRVSLLQGPPGTGKTKGAHARAVVGRLHATVTNDDRDTPFSALLTGPSGTAVTEFLRDTAELTAEYVASDEMPCDDTDIEVVKLVLNTPPAADQHDDITYIDYNSDAGIDRLTTLLTDTDADRDAQPHVIIGSTPGRVHKTAQNLFDDPYQHPPGLFDVVAMDEASMAQLPHLFLVTAFLHADDASQLLIGGDHRQMPPVQHHDWESERQSNILRHLPFLSVLNYFRFIRGEDVDRIPDEAPVRPPVADEEPAAEATGLPADRNPHADLPMERLVVSYRCHELLTNLVGPHHYEQDGIEFTSNTRECMDPSESWYDAVRTDDPDDPDDPFDHGATAALGPEPLVVIPHDETTSAQSNPMEAALSAALTERLADTLDWGCVTPHKSQTGVLRTRCGAPEDVDTVESFQGGERDVVTLSATVSDPDYQQVEQEFLLSANRLNVALTRMKQKVIVLVPETLLHITPRDAEDYEAARLWKALREVHRTQSADWTGTLSEFAPDIDDVATDTDLRVYAVNTLPDEAVTTDQSGSQGRSGAGSHSL